MFPGKGLFGVALLALAILVSPTRSDAYEARLVSGDVHVILDTGSAILAGNGEGNLLRSTDHGESFFTVQAGDSSDAILALQESEGTVIAAGRSGVVYRSTDDGLTWEERSSGATAILGDWTGVATDGAGTWVVVGADQDHCAALVSADDGRNWTLVDVAIEGTFSGVAWHPAGSVFVAVGGDGMFDGFALSSESGTSWTPVAVPAGTAPLRFVSSDGVGGLLAGGESGAGGSLLISSGDLPEFSFLPDSGFSETLLAAVPVGTVQWLAAGTDTLLIEIFGQTGTDVLGPPVPGGEPIRSLAFIAPSTLLVTGALPQMEDEAVSALAIRIEPDRATGNLVVTATGARVDRTYFLETSGDLVGWEPVAGSERIASGSTLEWEVTPPDEPRGFWRVSSD